MQSFLSKLTNTAQLINRIREIFRAITTSKLKSDYGLMSQILSNKGLIIKMMGEVYNHIGQLERV